MTELPQNSDKELKAYFDAYRESLDRISELKQENAANKLQIAQLIERLTILEFRTGEKLEKLQQDVTRAEDLGLANYANNKYFSNVFWFYLFLVFCQWLYSTFTSK